MKTIGLNRQQFESLFPFYFETDSVGCISHLGRSLSKLTTQAVLEKHFDEVFEFQRPKSFQYSAGLHKISGEMINLRISGTPFELMGQSLRLQDDSGYIFVVNLMVRDASDLASLNLTFQDFAVQDPIFDFLMLLQTQKRAINDAEKLNKKLDEARKIALKASATKSQFLANMSHELRTPMNGVLGMASVLRDTALDQDQLSYLDTIIESGENMVNLVNDILDLSKVESGHIELDMSDLSIVEVIDRSLESVSVLAQRKNIQLVLKRLNELPARVTGDSVRLRQVLLNLLGNAIKFTATGSVTLAVSTKSEKENQIELLFEVIDTGIGMDQETLGKIFSPFIQADSSMTKTYGGTGLGLSICKTIVEAMNGSIGVHSSPGAGSTFWFCLTFDKIVAKEAHET